MEDSILKSTKKVLGVGDTYTAFNEDITMYINSAFSNLHQLGFGTDEGIVIEDERAKWSDLDFHPNVLNMAKAYIYLKVRMLFDPPTTSFHIDAMTKQIQEYEWRLTVFKDALEEVT